MASDNKYKNKSIHEGPSCTEHNQPNTDQISSIGMFCKGYFMLNFSKHFLKAIIHIITVDIPFVLTKKNKYLLKLQEN